MKPIAILASLLTLAPAQDTSTPPEATPPVEPQTPDERVDLPPPGSGPLATILSDRAALFVDMAKAPHKPVRSRTRDPFLFPAEQEAGKSVEAIEAEQAELARIEHEQESEALEAAASPAAPPVDPMAELVASVQALEISAVLVAKNGGSCLVHGDIVRIGDTMLGGRATLTRVGRDGVSFAVGERTVDVALQDRSVKRSAEEFIPTPSNEDTGS